MRSSRFSPEQVVQVLKEDEASPMAEVCRHHGISAQTFYRWKAKYGDMEISSDARRLKQLEDENRRLRRAPVR